MAVAEARGVRAALLALVALLAGAATAEAATVQVVAREQGFSPHSGPLLAPVLDYQAADGEENRIVVTPEPGGFRVRDEGADVEPGAGCSRAGAREATCSTAVAVAISAGDRDDTVALGALSVPASVAAGVGDDRVDGTSAPDSLLGQGGTDRLLGSGGADTLDDGDTSGSANADVLDGGDGDGDWVVYAERSARVIVDLGRPGIAGEVRERDSLTGVENVTGGSGSDLIQGDGGANRLEGGRGRDAVDGGDGDDRLDLGRGNDVGAGGAGDDELLATRGRDRLIGGAGDDDLASGTGRGGDRLLGGSGRDRLYAGRGRDVLKGRAGPDVIYANDGRRDRVNGGPGSDRAKVDRGLDSVRSVETLR